MDSGWAAVVVPTTTIVAAMLQSFVGFRGIDKRFDGIDKRIDGVDNRIAELKNDMLREAGKADAKLDTRLDKLVESRVDHEVRLRLIEGKKAG